MVRKADPTAVLPEGVAPLALASDRGFPFFVPEYRRAFAPGGTLFFTLVTEGRMPILCTESARPLLRAAILEALRRWPFTIEAVVLLPDHLHTLWTLPEGDSAYPRRLAQLSHGEENRG